MTVPIPGFDAYLRRTYGSLEDVTKQEIHLKARSTGSTIDFRSGVGVTRGDLTVVDVKHSTNIKRLEYDATEKTLATTFVSGGVAISKRITSEIFAQVAQPGPEFEYSVGKAYYQLVVMPSKRKR
jgi:hypothetical protein